jgi:hypothetical protein
MSRANVLLSQLTVLNNELKNIDSKDFKKLYGLLSQRDRIVEELEEASPNDSNLN